MTTLFPVTSDGHVIAAPDGRPAVVPADWLADAGRTAVRIGADLTAVRVSAEELAYVAGQAGGEVVDWHIFAGDRAVAKAVALLRNRDRVRFDPADGAELAYDADGVVARGGATHKLFPRIDPAVIGLVTLAGEEKILLGRNRRRRYFSLVAGYVDSGENLEEAFAREVLEETGRRIRDLAYWGSQPWPVTGSLMMAFTAVTDDHDAVTSTDGELAEIRWADRRDLDRLPIARPGSIANRLINEWRDRH
jgi:NAD+ diphosphatase